MNYLELLKEAKAIVAWRQRMEAARILAASGYGRPLRRRRWEDEDEEKEHEYSYDQLFDQIGRGGAA